MCAVPIKKGKYTHQRFRRVSDDNTTVHKALGENGLAQQKNI
ncbi:hypothetical protein VCEC0051_003865 [Vibrio cholerae O1 str. EC-0051]|nr:hypothetical protein VCEC0051_003865 [Vibrio cholerae O1 str. EC-0051]